MTTATARRETGYRFWRKVGKETAEPRALQLVLPEGTPMPEPFPVVRGRWTPMALAAIAGIVADAKTERQTQVSLPYVTLCAALQVHMPEATLVNARMGDTWGPRTPRPPVFEIPVGGGGHERHLRRAHEALATWIERRLRPFAEGCGVNGGKVAELADLAARGAAFAVDEVGLSVPPDILGGKDAFGPGRDFILAWLAERMPGLAPFSGPDMGELHLVVRSDARGNDVEFVTWPRVSGPMLVSAVVTVSVETAPWTPSPIVRVEVSKRRWLKGLPQHFGVQRNVTGYALVRDRHVAVNMPIKIQQGRTAEVGTPAFVLSLLDANRPEDQTLGLDDLIKRGTDGRIFVGVPFKTTYRGVMERGGPAAGASTLDLTEAFETVAECLAPLGFVEAPGRPVKAIKHYEQYRLGALAPAHVVQAHDEWEAAGGAPAWAGKPAQDARPSGTSLDKFESLREGHDRRLTHAYGPGTVVTVRTFASQSDEWLAVRLVARALYGERVVIESAPLPPNTHGPFRAGDRRNRKERNQDKIGAWQQAATALGTDCDRLRPGQPRLALVMARKSWPVERDGKAVTLSDDTVSKPATRTALAEYARANTQFLIPLGTGEGLVPGEKPFDGFVLRAQAALNDLLFGHRGLVAPIRPALEKTFPNGDAPTCVVGITMVRKNRGTRGGDASSVLAAVRIGATVQMGTKGEPDVRLDGTTIRLAWHEDAAPNVTEWMPYHEGLCRMGAFSVGSIGSNFMAKRDTTQAFVRKLLDGLRDEGERPLVLIDATGLAGLWPWLNDRAIRGGMTVDAGIVDPASEYPGFRFVRMRSFDIPRVVASSDATFHAIDETGATVPEAVVVRNTPTMVVNIVRTEGDGDGLPCHLLTMGYNDINHQVARGQSNFAQASQFVNLRADTAKEWPEGVERKGQDIHDLRALDQGKVGTKPYRKPEALDLAMPVLCPGDDPDKVAALVALLRSASGHTDAKTFLPAPLSFERQLKNYMGRYALDEDDIPDLPAEDPFEDELAEDGAN